MQPTTGELTSMKAFLEDLLADPSVASYADFAAYPKKMLQVVELASSKPDELSQEQLQKLQDLQKEINLSKRRAIDLVMIGRDGGVEDIPQEQLESAQHETAVRVIIDKLPRTSLEEIEELEKALADDKNPCMQRYALFNLQRYLQVYDYPFSQHKATESPDEYKRVRKITEHLSDLPIEDFYSLATADVSGQLWLAVLKEFPDKLIEKCSVGGIEGFIDFLKMQGTFLTYYRTIRFVQKPVLKEIFAIIGDEILPRMEEIVLFGQMSARELQSARDLLIAVEAIPCHQEVLVEHQNLTGKLRKLVQVVDEALAKIPLAPPVSYKQKKLCLVFHGTGVDCGVPTTIEIAAEALKADPANLVHEFGGPDTYGDGSSGKATIVGAVEEFKSRFLDWIGSLREPVTNFEVFIGGFSRGAVNGFRASYEIHQWLLADSTIEELMKKVPAGFKLKNIDGQEIDFETATKEEVKTAFQQFFLDTVHIDFYAHDPVPGQMMGITSGTEALGGGWRDRYRFHLPSPDFDLHRNLKIVFVEHEQRDAFASMLDEKDVRASFQRLVKFRETYEGKQEIQMLAGGHADGIQCSGTVMSGQIGYQELLRRIPSIRLLLESPELSVDKLIEQLNKDDFWQNEEQRSFAIIVVNELLSLAMMGSVIGRPIPPALAVGIREDGRILHLKGELNSEVELKLYALIRNHLSVFEDSTKRYYIPGADYVPFTSYRTFAHKRESCKFLVDRENGLMSFFQNYREVDCMKSRYPAIYEAIDKVQGFEDLVKLEKQQQLVSLTEELIKLANVDPRYAVQVVICLAVNEAKGLVTFNDSESSQYWFKIISEENIKKYCAKITTAKEPREIVGVVDEIRNKVKQSVVVAQSLASRSIVGKIWPFGGAVPAIPAVLTVKPLVKLLETGLADDERRLSLVSKLKVRESPVVRKMPIWRENDRKRVEMIETESQEHKKRIE